MDFFPEGALLDRPLNRRYISSLAGLGEASRSGEILEGRAVLCDSQHNLIVELANGIRGMIPRQEAAVGIREGSTRDIAILTRVNKPVCFTVTGFCAADKNVTAILSRRAAQLRCQEEYILKLVPGDVIPAKITHLEPFGAFVDIGCGVVSMIPIDFISVSRISHPAERFSVGQNILAVVRSVSDGRINLSHKELLGTWEQNASLFEPGQTVAGIVRSVESYGAFIELRPNLAGLAEPRQGLYSGVHASVFIKSIIPSKMKIKLVVIDAFEAGYDVGPLDYYITGGHISHWRYSPDECQRIIETQFE